MFWGLSITTSNNNNMKHTIPIMLYLLQASSATLAQSVNHNYVESFTVTECLTDDELYERGGIENVNAAHEVTYYDGLGRPVLHTRDTSLPQGTGTIVMTAYDSNGNVSKEWMPVHTSGDLSYISATEFRGRSEDLYNDRFGYITKCHDALGHQISSQNAGAMWKNSGKESTTEYRTNGVNEVKWYKAPMEKVTLVQDGYYPAASLNCEATTDEDGKTMSVYKDFLGNKVLERRDGDNDTYYVYNDIGQLRYVLSPEYQKSGYKEKYAYEYRYDTRGRIVKRILPGCAYTQYWYDAADRMTFMQDATLREKELYRFFLYDPFGRLAIQGLCSNCDRSGSICPVVYRKGQDGMKGTGYVAVKPGIFEGYRLEVINYYDNYDFVNHAPSFAGSLADSLNVEAPCNATGNMTGRVQYASVRMPMAEVYYYDLRSRVIDRRTVWNSRRYTSIHDSYNQTDRLVRQGVRVYDINAKDTPELTVDYTLENVYDIAHGALLATNLTVRTPNGKEKSQTVASYTYDKLGRTRTLTHGGLAGSVTYGYDIHGWPVTIDGKGFYEELHYAEGPGTPCYSGNISSMLWSAVDYGKVRGYKFEYDGLDRLTRGIYGETPSLSDKLDRYSEEVLEYTANGNIRRFQRRGLKDDGVYGKIDNLHAKYDGNQLRSVTDDAPPANKYSSLNFIDGADEETEYEYNGVGALTRDRNRGIKTITYDERNNLDCILFNGGTAITYVYLPDGTKMGIGSSTMKGCIVLNTWNTEYSGDLIYENGSLSKLLFPGGYCTFDGGFPVFHYFTQDHLGNNRLVTNEDGTAEQITHYYPFGGTFNDTGLNPELQQYKYNGKELDRTAGLNTYDYGARQYFPALPRWDRMDKMCEKYYELSPYLLCGNNPINRIDKDGKDWYYSKSGTYLGRDQKLSDNIIIRERNIRMLGNPSWQQDQTKYKDVRLSDIELSVEAYSNIFTDIMIKNGFDMLKTGSGKIEVTKTDYINIFDKTSNASEQGGSNAVTTQCGDVFNITAMINTGYYGTQSLFSTVSNVISILGIHEYKGHGINKYNNKSSGHIKIRKMLQKDPTYKKITKELRNHIDNLEKLY